MKKILLLLLTVLTMSTVSAKDIKTVTFKVEQMMCVNCEAKVKKNISFEKGVKNLTTDVQNKTATIVYDAEKTSVENLQKGFKKFGYTAEVLSGPTSVKKDKKDKADKHKVDGQTGATQQSK